ncbi:hypothetical protein ACHAXM_005023 [Skeletonema potamos]|jgi:hypothetical protein
MDFEIAAQRLANDQKSALARSRASRNARAASSKARREAQEAKAKAEARLREKKLESERNAKIVDRVVQYVRRVERKLGATNVDPSSSNNWSAQSNSGVSVSSANESKSLIFDKNPIFAQGWKLQATSIHGEGDKIALPPSILETLTSNNNASGLDPWDSGRNGRPLAFRIGVLDPEYTGFPASEKMKALVDKVKEDVIASEKTTQYSLISSAEVTNCNDEMMSEDSDCENEADETSTHVEAYLDELSHRYISYTHGTVVEFTQEDGCVGLPEPIARSLLQQNLHSLGKSNERQNRIPIKRTVDPASSSSSSLADVDAMDIEVTNDSPAEVQSEKTPGHLAYGAFDIPDLPIEITPINCLPAGSDCTFTPTASSIKNGFYNLKDVKLVLEQSLIRTRATLSKGDVIRTWRRGVSFDLIVSNLSPSEFGVVSCVNTDLNVDIGPPDEDDLAGLNVKPDHVEGKESKQSVMGQGRLLSEDTQQKQRKEVLSSVIETKSEPAVDLAPEPAYDKVEGVCKIQIRGRSTTGDTISGIRRFDVEMATMHDLFQYASSICGADPKALRLVTRFPRRVFAMSSEGEQGHVGNDATLKSVGINQGQELFMVEYF